MYIETIIKFCYVVASFFIDRMNFWSFFDWHVFYACFLVNATRRKIGKKVRKILNNFACVGGSDCTLSYSSENPQTKIWFLGGKLVSVQWIEIQFDFCSIWFLVVQLFFEIWNSSSNVSLAFFHIILILTLKHF